MYRLGNLPFRSSVGGQPLRELMICSSAGTGKSVGVQCRMFEWCETYDNFRILVLRESLTRLRETWQASLEEVTLPLLDRPTPKGSRASRTKYTFGNGSEILLGGMDDPQRYRSFEGNVVWVVEGNEISEEAYEELFRALRWSKGWGLEKNFLGLECNPDSNYHWAYKRFFGELTPQEVLERDEVVAAPGRIALQAQHENNPAYHDGEDWTPQGRMYLESLEHMSGVRLRRLRYGEWCAAEGAIFDNFEASRHVIRNYRLDKKDDGFWWIQFDDEREDIRLNWFASGQDWGFENPGVFSVWGFDSKQRMYLVEEVYMSRRDDSWWAEQIKALQEKYAIWRCVSDPENASGIHVVNRKVRAIDGRPFLIKADKYTGQAGRKKFAQLMHCHSLLENGMCFFLDGSRKHQEDPELKGKKPTHTVAEIPGMQWKPPTKEGDEPTDQPLKRNDHGTEAWSYLAWATFQRDLTPPPDRIVKPYHVSDVLTQDPKFKKMMRARSA